MRPDHPSLEEQRRMVAQSHPLLQNSAQPILRRGRGIGFRVFRTHVTTSSINWIVMIQPTNCMRKPFSTPVGARNGRLLAKCSPCPFAKSPPGYAERAASLPHRRLLPRKRFLAKPQPVVIGIAKLEL